MNASKSSIEMRKLIDKAIENHEITRREYDLILHKASEDSVIDPHEQALLSQLNDMIEDKSIKMKP